MVNLKVLGLMFLVGISSFCGSAFAQTGDSQTNRQTLEEIVVTASRREESLQDTSISVSAVTGGFLNSVGATTLDDYMGYVPSVNAASNTAGERGGLNILIRGISNTRIALGDASLLTATTGFYLNDIPITAIDTQLFDVDRVEVLRGPQGTLYGAASQGGAIKLLLNKPDLYELEGAAEGSYSFLDGGGQGNDVSAMLNMPIFEGVFGIRIVGEHRERDGFINTFKVPLDNLSGQVPSPVSDVLDVRPAAGSRIWIEGSNDREATGGSISALYTPNENLRVDFTQLWQLTKNGDVNWVDSRFNGEFEQEKFILEPNQSDTTLSGLTISYDFNPFTVVSNTGYYTREYDEIIDFTLPVFNGEGFNAVLDYVPAAVTLTSQGDMKTFTQEFRLESNRSAFSDSILGRLDWVFGGFYMDSTRTFIQIQEGPGWEAASQGNPLPLPNDLRSISNAQFDETSESMFLDLTYNVSENFAVGGGIRLFDLSTELNGSGLNVNNPVTPTSSNLEFSEDGDSIRLGASYDFNDVTKVFANFSDGFRLGGAVTPINFDTDPLCAQVIEDNGLEAFATGRFGSDNVETFEVGLKKGFADGRVTVNASAYTTEWSGLQSQVRLGDISTTCFQVITANVGKAAIDGFELEFSALASDHFSLQGSLAYTDAVIDDPGLSPFTAGDQILNVPEWSGSLVTRYETQTNALSRDSTFFVQGDVRYVGDRLPTTGSTDPRLLLDEYTLLGARLGFIFGGEKPTTITLWARNLLNERRELNSRLKIGVPSTVDNMGVPRTYGVTIRKDF